MPLTIGIGNVLAFHRLPVDDDVSHARAELGRLATAHLVSVFWVLHKLPRGRVPSPSVQLHQQQQPAKIRDPEQKKHLVTITTDLLRHTPVCTIATA